MDAPQCGRGAGEVIEGAGPTRQGASRRAPVEPALESRRLVPALKKSGITLLGRSAPARLTIA